MALTMDDDFKYEIQFRGVSIMKSISEYTIITKAQHDRVNPIALGWLFTADAKAKVKFLFTRDGVDVYNVRIRDNGDVFNDYEDEKRHYIMSISQSNVKLDLTFGSMFTAAKYAVAITGVGDPTPLPNGGILFKNADGSYTLFEKAEKHECANVEDAVWSLVGFLLLNDGRSSQFVSQIREIADAIAELDE